MKANVLTAIRQPLQTHDLPDPQPGPGQVRIGMRATGVCGTDVHLVNGELPVPLPIILGHEPVGEIDTIGPGVRSVKPGDRVGVAGSRPDAADVGTAKRNKSSSARNRKRGSLTGAATPTI
jgi:D-arabinose 1-dehydrogenase-like Zn-dependent alcohol dehydrogenase